MPLQRLEDTISVWNVFDECLPHTVRSLGIANVQLQELRELCQHVKTKASVVKNAYHPGTNFDVDVRQFCVQTGITYQAVWTLTANAELLSSEFISSLASRSGVEKAVALYYLIKKLENVVVLNGTSKAETMRRDLDQMLKLQDWAS